MARLNLTTWRRIAAITAAVGASTLALTGCTTSPNSVTITYETEDGTRSTTFTPDSINCDDVGTFGGSAYPQRPFSDYSIRTLSGRSAMTAWVSEDELIYIDSDEATVSTAERTDGSVEYHATAKGAVAVTEVRNPDAPPRVPPSEGAADWYDGTIEATITCPPAE